MIANPPHIIALLRAWNTRREPAHLADLITTHLGGPMLWPEFLATWRLYLQSIPLATAREAWGLTQTAQNSPSQP